MICWIRGSIDQSTAINFEEKFITKIFSHFIVFLLTDATIHVMRKLFIRNCVCKLHGISHESNYASKVKTSRWLNLFADLTFDCMHFSLVTEVHNCVSTEMGNDLLFMSTFSSLRVYFSSKKKIMFSGKGNAYFFYGFDPNFIGDYLCAFRVHGSPIWFNLIFRKSLEVLYLLYEWVSEWASENCKRECEELRWFYYYFLCTLSRSLFIPPASRPVFFFSLFPLYSSNAIYTCTRTRHSPKWIHTYIHDIVKRE